MKPKVYTYENPERRQVAYRGYVQYYDKDVVSVKTCDHVRKNRLQAIEDAKKLLAKLRREKT